MAVAPAMTSSDQSSIVVRYALAASSSFHHDA